MGFKQPVVDDDDDDNCCRVEREERCKEREREREVKMARGGGGRPQKRYMIAARDKRLTAAAMLELNSREFKCETFV